MEEILAAIIDFQAAIIGAIVGAVITLMVTFIRGYLDTEREWVSLAVKAGIEDHNAAIQLAVAYPTQDIAPFQAYVYYNYCYFKILKKRGRNLKSSDLQKIKEETITLYPPSTTTM